MHTQIIIHFANIFERANFGKVIPIKSNVKTLTHNFCLINSNWNRYPAYIRACCPTSKILIKQTKNKRTTYTEWRP